MSFVPVMGYLMGLGVFGFTYWLMDGILDDFIAVGVHETGNIWDFLQYGWVGLLIIYIIFGGIWVIKKYNENQYSAGGFM